jgi:ABC-2 type transport system permease protein
VIRAFRAELVKVLRRRVLVMTALVVAVYGVGGAAIVLAGAEPAAAAPAGRAVTLEDLADAGGGTAVFRQAVSFAGFFVFVVFTGAVAVEFGRGTFRTMLLRQPNRLRLLAGKMLALLAFAAGVLAAAELVTWTAAKLLAPSQDVATGEWVGLAALGQGLADYAAVVFWVGGYALLGMVLVVTIRSVPIALGVGIAWAGPFEHLVQEAWASASVTFPGLLLEAFAAGGTSDVTATQAAVTIAVYAVVAAAAGGAVFARRDITP